MHMPTPPTPAYKGRGVYIHPPLISHSDISVPTPYKTVLEMLWCLGVVVIGVGGDVLRGIVSKRVQLKEVLMYRGEGLIAHPLRVMRSKREGRNISSALLVSGEDDILEERA